MAGSSTPASGKERSTQVTADNSGLRLPFSAGLALGMLVLAGLLAWWFLFWQPARSGDLLDRLAQYDSSRVAAAVADDLKRLRNRMQATANSELARNALAAGAPALERLRDRLQDRFPEAHRVHLVPASELGTAKLQPGSFGLENHIEVDLVRQAARGELAGPEGYALDDSEEVALAVAGTHAGNEVVLLLVLSEAALANRLRTLAGEGTILTLSQQLPAPGAQRNVELLTTGASTGTGRASAPVAGSPWTVAVAEDSRWRAALVPGPAAVAALCAGPLVAVLLALGVSQVLLRRCLRLEVEKVRAAAMRRSAVHLRLADLLPLLRLLRERHGGSKASASSEPVHRRAAPPQREDRPPEAAVPATVAQSTPAAPSSPPVESRAEPTAALPAAIFRAYDIRGVADRDLTDANVERIGRAIATVARDLGEDALILGHDGRLSSRRIRDTLRQALLDGGCDVIDIGRVPTPVAYYATRNLAAGSAVMVTGSHHPGHYNGFKIVLDRKALAEGQLDRIRDCAQQGGFSSGEGALYEESVDREYLDEISSDIALAVPLKVVIDAGNGVTGELAPLLFEALGCEVIQLYCEIDGSFPHHPPDTSNEDNLSDLCAVVRKTGADLGLAFDGDGDRVAAVTGSGKIVRTDILLMILAQDVVSRNPGTDVVYDVKCSRHLAQLVTRLGGRPVLWKTGHALMSAKMAETGAMLGGEFSGHVFFGERWYGFDDGLYTAARLAELVSGHTSGLDDLVAQLPASQSTPEILVPVDDAHKFEVIARFAETAAFPGARITTLDGFRADYNDGWGLLRASNTSAALTARFEADSSERLQEIMEQFRRQLGAAQPDLAITF